jgi:hypothetical protein
MSERLLEFHCRPDLLGVLPPPVPACKCMPEWIRRMPATAAGADGQVETVKNCMPFIEAMTYGYVIGLPADMTFTMEGNTVRADVVGFDMPLVDFHGGEQFPGAPFGGMGVVKFHTPWLVRTPPGYSTLFLPPLNRFEMPFMPLAGMVETDTYYRQVAFPSLCMMQSGQQVKLAKGTPIVQLVPVPREEWRGLVSSSDVTAWMAQHQEWEANRHMYREGHWKKKAFR